MKDNSVPAVEYVRMSTEDQKYSIANQQAVIAEYASQKNYRVIETFADRGVSGLDLKHRPGLKALLAAVVSHDCAFRTILVLDVSRWGRFQDVDESAFYEFLCRQSGVSIQYCGEPFENNQSVYSNLIKSIKRMMAAEYSRELSAKTFQGAVRLARAGYKQGGPARLGLRRLLVDKEGHPKQFLNPGEQKGLVSDRVILVPGAKEEVEIVQRVFDDFIAGKSVCAIADELRSERVFGRSWTRGSVQSLLENPQYGGSYVYNRVTSRLGTNVRRSKPEDLTVAINAIPPIISAEKVSAAQKKMNNLTVRLSDDAMLERLKRHAGEWGHLSCTSINESRELPSSRAYIDRFGSLESAYRLIEHQSDPRGNNRRTRLAALRREQWDRFAFQLAKGGLTLGLDDRKKFRVNLAETLPVVLILAVPVVTRKAPQVGPEWTLRLQGLLPRSRLLIAVLSCDTRRVVEYAVCSSLPNAKLLTVVNIPKLAAVTIARFRLPSEYLKIAKRLANEPVSG